jgi:hypothetical protein
MNWTSARSAFCSCETTVAGYHCESELDLYKDWRSDETRRGHTALLVLRQITE